MPVDLTRRRFIQMLGGAGVAYALAGPVLAQLAESVSDALRVAIIGPGQQGRHLLGLCQDIPGLRFTALCDIWPFHQQYAARILQQHGHEVAVYEDYRQMLEREADRLDAVIIATPDWMHAEQTEACLAAGLHVYCEKAMARTAEEASRMTAAARSSGRLLQIGTHRRSHPLYRYVAERIGQDGLLGQVVGAGAQWNRPQRQEVRWAERYALDADTLTRYGYGDMNEFRNWRWHRRYCAGPMADVGVHQLDVLSWLLGTQPAAVTATGGLDHYDTGQWYDNVQTAYEYPTEAGTVRADYRYRCGTTVGGYYESIIGRDRTLMISEDPRNCYVLREPTTRAAEWEDAGEPTTVNGLSAVRLRVGLFEGQPSEEGFEKPAHQYHLENFFAACRGQAELTCPPNVAEASLLAALAANQAIEEHRRVELQSC